MKNMGQAEKIFSQIFLLMIIIYKNYGQCSFQIRGLGRVLFYVIISYLEKGQYF